MEYFNYLGGIIIIIIIRHDLGLHIPVPAWSNSFFEGLLSRLRPFGLQFRITFGILMLFILVTCRSQFYFIFQFLVNWFYLQLFQNFFIPFVVRKYVSLSSSEKF